MINFKISLTVSNKNLWLTIFSGDEGELEYGEEGFEISASGQNESDDKFD